MAKRDLGITLIALGKLAKAAVLITIGIMMIAGHAPHSVTHAARVLGVSEIRIAYLGIGSLGYAALFLVEGGGLWLRKKWAEWLTLIITSSFVPLEVYEVVRHASGLKLAVLVLNLAAVVYLLVRRVKHRDPSSLPPIYASER